jgi:glycosyltransferase involved in cell wall biosynthesis
LLIQTLKFIVPRRALFLTGMPSPYQRELFDALHSDSRIEIRVLYYTYSDHDRHWSIPSLSPYEKVLPGKTFGWLGPSAHVNPSIIAALRHDASDLFILSDYAAPTTQIAMRYLNWRKKPWVFWGEVPGLRSRGRLRGFTRDRLQRPLSGAVAIAAIGSVAMKAYQELFPQIPVFNIPYFCDLARFKAAPGERANRLNSTIVILFSGQLIERKGVDLLLRAFIRIAHRLPTLELHMLGTGPALETLRKLIPPDLSCRIHFLGFKQPAVLPAIFATADIFVLPSRHDGWGVVVNEALGSGLPIIVSDRVGARDLVDDGRNGLITPAGDIEELADALLRLGQSAEMRRSFAAASAARAAHWGLEEGVRRWIELYDNVIGKPQNKNSHCLFQQSV